MTNNHAKPDTHDETLSHSVQDAAPQTEPRGEGDDASAPEAPERRIADLENALTEMKDRWMRAEAENQNLRTRAKRDVEDARQYSVQKFARDVVEAAENLKRGLTSLPPAQEGEDSVVTKLREGFEGIERSFLSILERHGVTCSDPTGQPFDANLHQAMAEQPSGEHPPGHVIQAWTPAWKLKDRLLKPAMVVVADASSSGAQKSGGARDGEQTS